MRGLTCFARRGVRSGVLAAVAALVIALPASAFAANTASFSFAMPRSGSISSFTRSTISITVYDPNGVNGVDRCSMTLDGSQVTSSMVYRTPGDARWFRLEYTPGRALAPGRHTVTVTVRDTADAISMYSWWFATSAPPDPHVLLSVPACVGTDCHTGWADVKTLHSRVRCGVCHGTSGAKLTVECSTAGCHGSTDRHPVADPHPRMVRHTTGLPASCVGLSCHVADVVALHSAKKNCATCHVEGKTAPSGCGASGCHPDGGSPLHAAHTSTVSSAVFRMNNLTYGTYACSLCHASTELIEAHGGRSSCPKCHPSAADGAKPWNGSCTQNGCHSVTSKYPMHADLQVSHLTDTQPGCTIDGCHFGNSTVGGRDTVLMHFAKQKCETCHGNGKTPTKQCASCHTQARTGDHQADHRVCNECHAPFVWNQATSTANKGAQLSPVHWPMFDAKWTVLIGRAWFRTGYPFGDYTMLQFPGPIGVPGPQTSTYDTHTGTYTCTTCHTGAGKKWVHPGSDYFTCGSGGDCHQHHGNWDPAENSESYVHNTPPANWVWTMKW